MMNETFYDFKEIEEFNDFIALQHQDDAKLKEKFEGYNHREFQYCLINIGVMLDIVRGYFYFEQQKIDKNIIQLKKEKVKIRRVNHMLKELNEKINLRYNFDDDVRVIKSLAIYQEEGYLLIDKCLFADLVLEKAEIDL